MVNVLQSTFWEPQSGKKLNRNKKQHELVVVAWERRVVPLTKCSVTCHSSPHFTMCDKTYLQTSVCVAEKDEPGYTFRYQTTKASGRLFCEVS